jgi:hypothetical protein
MLSIEFITILGNFNRIEIFFKYIWNQVLILYSIYFHNEFLIGYMTISYNMYKFENT